MQKLPIWFKNKKIVVGIAVTFIIVVVIVSNNRSQSSLVDTVPVVLDTLTQGISVTGKVVALDEVKLGFDTTGRVSEILAYTGESVYVGQVLVKLNSGDTYAKLLQAQAQLEIEQAQLVSLKKGARPEELAVSEVKVANARVSLEDSKSTVLNSIHDGYTKSDDAIRNKVDQFMLNPRGQNPKLNISTDQQLTIDIESGRRNLEAVLLDWQKENVGLSINTDLTSAVVSSEKHLSSALAFLDKVSLAINGLSPSSNLSQATISGYKSDILTARTNVNTSISTLATAKEKLRSAESSLSLAEKNLSLDKAGATEEDLRAEEAEVKSAEANVANYESQLANTIIRAPFGGVITIQEGKVGQITTAGSLVVALSGAELIIEAFVPEVDIAQVTVGNIAKVTLDAYGGDTVFSARVFSIDPAETITDGVSTYKIKLRFEKSDVRVKSGMTANIDATTIRKEGVLTVPARAVVTREGKRIVQVISGEEVSDREIKVGIRGVDGKIEVLSGVSEGELIVLPPKK